MTPRDLQTLRNMGNEAEEAADEIDRLRAELERLRAQEPVAWQQRYIDSEEGPSLWRECSKNDIEVLRTSPQREVRPLYRAAPPAQPAQRLTDEHRQQLVEVLRGGRQCDEDGVEIIMSRQACCEAADIIESAIAAAIRGS